MTGTGIFDWDDIAAVEGNGASRREIAGTGAALKRIRVAAGTVAARHSHPHEQFVLVQEGGLRLRTEDGVRALRAGMVVRFAPDTWHEAEFVADTVLIEVNLAVPS